MAAPNQSPVFTLTSVLAQAVVSAANTNRTATGTRPTLCTGAAFGTRIDRIVIKATVTTTAGLIRFWVSDGATDLLIHEEPVTAVTPSGTVAAFTAEIIRADGAAWLDLPSGAVLKCATVNAENFSVFVIGGTY